MQMRGKTTCAVAAALLVVAGCLIPPRGAKAIIDSRIPPVIYLPPVENIWPLTPEEVQTERVREHREAVAPAEDLAAAAGVLPKGYVVCSVKSAGEVHAVIGRLATHDVVPPNLWFCDKDWQMLGEVTGLPQGSEGPYHNYVLELRPHPDGVYWGVIATLEGGASVAQLGFIRLPELTFRPKLRLEGGADLAWRGDRVILSVSLGADPKSSIVELSPESGALKILYQEDASVAGRAPIGHIVLSSDGRRLAFARAPLRSHLEYGLWLLDTATGRCQKAVYDETGLLDCMPIRWDGPDTLVFTHTTERGARVRHTWYRARLKLSADE